MRYLQIDIIVESQRRLLLQNIKIHVLFKNGRNYNILLALVMKAHVKRMEVNII